MSINQGGYCMYCGKIGTNFRKYATPLGRMEYCSKLCWSKWINVKEHRPFEVIKGGKE